MLWVTLSGNQNNRIGHRSNTGFHDASRRACSLRLKLREEVRERIPPMLLFCNDNIFNKSV